MAQLLKTRSRAISTEVVAEVEKRLVRVRRSWYIRCYCVCKYCHEEWRQKYSSWDDCEPCDWPRESIWQLWGERVMVWISKGLWFSKGLQRSNGMGLAIGSKEGEHSPSIGMWNVRNSFCLRGLQKYWFWKTLPDFRARRWENIEELRL